MSNTDNFLGNTNKFRCKDCKSVFNILPFDGLNCPFCGADNERSEKAGQEEKYKLPTYRFSLNGCSKSLPIEKLN